MQTAPPAIEVPSYFHSIDGRMRIKVSEVKGSSRKAAEVEDVIGAIPGVDQVTANPLTGNVLILYDTGAVAQQQLLHTLKSMGCLRSEGKVEPRKNKEIGHGIAKYVLQSVTEVAVERLILALI
jgi:copper chaperone CopZ